MKAAALSAATDVPTAVGQPPVPSRLCVRSAARCTVIRIPAIICRQKCGYRRTANITMSALMAVKTHLDEEACSGGTAAVPRKLSARYAASPTGIWIPDNHINLTEVEAVAATQQAEGNTGLLVLRGTAAGISRDADASEEISQEDTVIDKLPRRHI